MLIQRTVMDGEEQRGQLWDFNLGDVSNKETSWKVLYAALSEYAQLEQQNTSAVAGKTDQDKGNAFFAEVDLALKKIADAAAGLGGEKQKPEQRQWLAT